MKISIVIPTRNRSEFLRYCVATCLACEDDNIEVVVSDNNSEDNTRTCMASISDPRLKYVCTGESLSMRQNFEFALDHAAGEYIIYIGDDDGILPNGIVTTRRLIERYQPDILLWRHITYDWPRGDGSVFPGRLKFRCRDFCGPMKRIDPRDVYRDFCQGRRINYREAANIYHGCVHRRVIDQVRSKQDGIYFNDINPDINTSFMNLTASRSILWFRNPVTIAGAGEKSNGYAFTPRSDISKAQKDVTKDYASLVTEDPVPPKLGVNIRSIAGHTYANLCSINSSLADQEVINHEAWRRVIIDDMKTFKPAMRKWDALESFFSKVDPSYAVQDLAESDPEAKVAPHAEGNAPPQTDPNANTAQKHKPAAHLQNVETVMRWLQAVTGRPYTPMANPPIALLQQTARSIGMQKRIRSLSASPKPAS